MHVFNITFQEKISSNFSGTSYSLFILKKPLSINDVVVVSVLKLSSVPYRNHTSTCYQHIKKIEILHKICAYQYNFVGFLIGLS